MADDLNDLPFHLHMQAVIDVLIKQAVDEGQDNAEEIINFDREAAIVELRDMIDEACGISGSKVEEGLKYALEHLQVHEDVLETLFGTSIFPNKISRIERRLAQLENNTVEPVETPTIEV